MEILSPDLVEFVWNLVTKMTKSGHYLPRSVVGEAFVSVDIVGKRGAAVSGGVEAPNLGHEKDKGEL